MVGLCVTSYLFQRSASTSSRLCLPVLFRERSMQKQDKNCHSLHWELLPRTIMRGDSAVAVAVRDCSAIGILLCILQCMTPSLSLAFCDADRSILFCLIFLPVLQSFCNVGHWVGDLFYRGLNLLLE